MRFSPLVTLLTLASLAAACTEAPLSPDRPLAVRTPSALLSPSDCTIVWELGVSGNWSDSLRWAPERLPTASDTACFTANGLYTVTLTGGSYAAAITVDDNAGVTLTATTTRALGTDYLHIRRLGRLTTSGCSSVGLGWSAISVVEGTLELFNGSACSDSSDLGYLNVIGLLAMDQAVADIDGMYLDGELRLTGNNRLQGGYNDAVMAGGAVTGSGHLTISASKGVMRWLAGALPSRIAPSQRARVRVEMPHVLLATGTATGALDVAAGLDPDPVVIEGDVPAGVDLAIVTPGDVELHHSLAAGAPRRYRVHGRLTTHPVGGTLRVEVDTLEIANRLLSFGDSTIVNAFRVDIDGRMDLQGIVLVAASYSPTAPTYSQHTSRGTIVTSAGGELAFGDRAELTVSPTTSHTGRLVLAKGTLVGSGTLDSLLVRGGTVDSGTVSVRVGTLDATVLRLDAQSQINLDVGGTTAGTFDEFRLRSLLEVSGTLWLRAINGFAGGTCGQLLEPFRVGSTGVVTGTFSTLSGTPLDSVRAWRVVPSLTGLQLAGFDPSVSFSVAPTSLALAEGGASASLQGCLGGPRPTATVTVIPTARRGEATVSPSPVTFTTANWALPQPLSAQAIDDARAEGPHVDSVRFTLASGDARYSGVARRQLHLDLADNDPAVDLALTLVTIDSLAAVNEQLDARFRVTNSGPGASTGSTFTITPMAGLEYVSNSAGVSCTAAAGVLTCTVGALAPGANTEFVILFRATSAGVHGNTGRIAGRDHDGSTGDNSLTWRVIIS